MLIIPRRSISVQLLMCKRWVSEELFKKYCLNVPEQLCSCLSVKSRSLSIEMLTVTERIWVLIDVIIHICEN